MSMSNWLRGNAFQEKDEYYTPKILVDIIVPYVPAGSTVWLPFDTEDSEFVHAFKHTHEVVFSHIWEGKDFFDFIPDKVDYVISNPPYSRKMDVLKRLYDLDFPFAMVLPLPCLNYQEVGKFFLDRELQLLIPDKKVSFNGNTASFNSTFFCHKLLPSNLMFAHLEHNNTGKNFVGSRMIS